ncbi:MAG: ABC transporter substrate-binding protein [Lachnospiraceae bacterium]|nr:ABC transporter substrate-binding protein [Lachnospiraceae bacterium]
MKNLYVKKCMALLCAGLAGASLLLSGCGRAAEGTSSSLAETAEESVVAEEAADSSSSLTEDSSADSVDEEQNETAGSEASEEETTEEAEDVDQASVEDAPEIPGLTCESVMDLVYAESFDVYYYSDGYKLIDVEGDRQFLLVPEDQEEPDDLDESIVVLEQPLENIYLAATSSMALFDAMDALDSIRMSALDESGWYVEHAAEAMAAGDILYGGKYSKPDYEMLISEGCSIAIESTMILHSPKVQEMIEDLGIPVFIDHSSYESHPLGRTEWIKCYGAMLDKEEAAEEFFNEQLKIIEQLDDFENTGKTMAYFHINTEGQAVVRTSSDYIPKMIEMAGGQYAFSDLTQEEGNRSASMTISMEQFYSVAKDADYLIYNASIDGALKNTDELIAKDALFKDFKAVKEGNVWTTEKSLYQATDTVGEFILDIHEMLTSGDESQMKFMAKVE